jgi:hypothetical protein
LVTQFTSFVAVEELIVTVAGEPVTVAVPVDIPAGVSYAGIFGQPVTTGSFQSPQLRALSPAPVSLEALGRLSGHTAARHVFRQPKEEMRDATIERDPAMVVQAKLAEPLRALDVQVAEAGKDGHLTVGKLRVVDYHVDVMVYLGDRSPQNLDALKQLGFVQTGESNVAVLLIGSIDVRKLTELAKLDAVIRITPVVA